MIKQEDVYRIGRLGKTHGVKGEITFMLDDDVFDRVDAEYLVLKTDGLLVPFFMEEYRFRSDTTALVKFCDIDTQEQARALTGCDVYFPYALTDDDGPATLSSLVGYELLDAKTQAPIGVIADVDDSTANVLFVLDDGRFVPAHDELITHIDPKKRQITTDLPEGLLEL